MPNHFFAPRTIRVFLQSLIIAAPLACSILLVDAGGVPASVLSSPSWTTYREQASGISLEFPRDVFVVDSGEAAVGLGRTYLSRDGRAILMIFSVARTPGISPAEFLRRSLGITGLKFSYKRVTPRFFAVSAVNRGKTFYGRCNFNSRDAKEMKCIYMEYPAEETRDWDKIVTRISLTLEH
jgi:hypothetical protein